MSKHAFMMLHIFFVQGKVEGGIVDNFLLGNAVPSVSHLTLYCKLKV